MSNIIYLSGKISGLSKAEYTCNFEKAEHDLHYFHYNLYIVSVIVNPLTLKPFLGIKKWLFFMIADIWQLRKCTHIALIPNWIDSKGAVVEFIFAKWIFKQQIIFL